MCQLRGLVAGQGKLDPFHLALFYGYWVHCGPFDIGMTTINGLGPLREDLANPNPNLAYAAAKTGMGATSLSNGSMMKTTPLAVWARNLSLEELEKCVQADVAMMHSKREMWDLVTAYCLAIKTLIKNTEREDRAEMALNAVREYGEKEGKTVLISQSLSEAQAIIDQIKNQQTGEIPEYFNIDVYNPQE